MIALALALVGCCFPWSGEPPQRPTRGKAADLPSPDRALTRIAIGSCSQQREEIPIFATIDATRPDLFLYIGDNVYGDETWGDPTLPALRQAYEDLAKNKDFKRFSHTTPILATWDDHDYGLNDASAGFFGRELSEELFERFWGEASLGAGHPGVYGARTFGPAGRRVQIVLLDLRSFRSEFEPSPDPDARKTMLGDAQWTWLAEVLREPADVRLLVSSTQVLADNHRHERWGRLPVEQEHLFRVLRESDARGLLLVSGDRHLASLYRREGVLGYPLNELTTSSLNVAFVTDDSELGTYQVGRVFTPENFGLVEIDWEGRVVAVTVRGVDGAVARELLVSFSDLGG